MSNDINIFLTAILNPPEPNEALKEASKDYLKFERSNNDHIPINHTIECHISKRTNRISRETGRHIKTLYIDEDKSIEEIATMLGKSVEAITKYLKKNKYL